MSDIRGLRDLERADAIFGALAHATRRQILLSVHIRREASAGDIAARFECSWPTVTRHLNVLAESGLLEARRSGRRRLYRCNSSLLRAVLAEWADYFAGAGVHGDAVRG